MTVKRLVSAFGLACFLGAASAAEEDPLAVSLTIGSAEIRGGFVEGEMDIAIVNHTSAGLRNVMLSLEQPSSGSIGGPSGVVSMGDLATDATARVVAPFTLDPAFFDSRDPYLVRARFIDIVGTDVDARVIILRSTGGGQ